VRPGPDSWDHGLRTFPVLLEIRGLRVPKKPEGGPRGPGLPREVRGRHARRTGLRRPDRSNRPRGPGPPSPWGEVQCRHVPTPWREALHGSPAHLPAFNAVVGPSAPKSKGVACH
jgi:hypothetical protein